MTSNQVTNSLGAMMMTQMNSAQITKKSEVMDFQSFMSNSEKKLEAAEVKTSEAKPVSKTEKNVKEENNTEPDGIVKNEKAEKVEVTREERQPEDDEIDAVKEAVKDIAEAIKETLDITDEQLEEALESLGLNMMALLIPENISDIAIEVTGEDSAISLVTNGELYRDVTELTGKVEDVIKDLTAEIDVEPEEFLEAVKEVSVTIPEENTPVVEDTPKHETPIKGLAVSRQERNLSKVETSLEEKIEVSKDEPKENVIRNLPESNNGEEETKEEFTSEDTPVFTKEVKAEVKETPVSFVQNLVEQTREVLNSVTETPVSYTTEQVKDIMDQMTESIRVTVDTENTEVNLRLHPESLGNVNVKITANTEGNLTAQFTAQNEAVKAVLETQAVVLKETLEAKGMTIEAVEVMVASHEFNEDLSNREEKSGQQGSKKSSTRRINLDSIDENTELSEEDTLAKEMMVQNGNTIDYTA